MSVRSRAAREPDGLSSSAGHIQPPSENHHGVVHSHTIPELGEAAGYSRVDFGSSNRLSMMLVPTGKAEPARQLEQILGAQRAVLAKHAGMQLTSQTVFLRREEDRKPCEAAMAKYFQGPLPATNFVYQPPCAGAYVALECWAIGGTGVSVEHCGPHTVRVEHEQATWTYCSGISSQTPGTAYQQTLEVLAKMQRCLEKAGSSFEHVVRTWLYLGRITEQEGETQRYKELNRARAEFYRGVQFHFAPSQPTIPQGIYPASTGIGMTGEQLVAGCLAVSTSRTDAFLLALENPQQTPAYAYHPRYSPQSPKFSRAVAMILGNHVTTWLSGTASVVHSMSRHPGDIERQTEQTIENIQKLICAENFGFHGVKKAGARLKDFAKIRVYLKRAQDFEKCKAICDRHFGSVPAIYAIADVCRPELLVEIEGVAFSRRKP